MVLKKFLLTAIAIFSTVIIMCAQGMQTATLHHNGEIKIFTSADALSQALRKSTHGDVIALSPGTFNSAAITKAVTIRGAGLEAMDSLSDFNRPTIIKGNYAINIPDSISDAYLYMEGITHTDNVVTLTNLKNATFAKCKFDRIAQGSNAVVNNVSFIHTIVSAEFNTPSKITLNAYNCFFKKINTSSGGPYNFYNCIFGETPIYNSYIENGIIINSSTTKSSISSSSNVCINTLWVGPHLDKPFPSSDISHNNYVAGDKEIVFIPNTFYRLQESSKYKGTDGLNVGIYGGSHPFTIDSSYPRIKKLKVAPESTKDGKLNIEIEISEN